MDKIFHSTFGVSEKQINDNFKTACMRLICADTPAPVRIFATGVGRQDFHTVGGKLAGHAVADATLEEVSHETGKEIVLTYLTGAQEASFGFDTMLEHSMDVLERAIVDCGITAPHVGVIQSGNGSTQVGVFVRATRRVHDLDAFDYGTQNVNPRALVAFEVWMEKNNVRDFISFGSESYAAPAGKIATNNPDASNPLHSGVDESARAAGAVKRMFEVATAHGKNYYVPERKAWNAKTSATLAMRKVFPDGTILDWGSGQIKNEESGTKFPFDQREMFGVDRA
jgi:hypothetical protein